jgi:hypothetical protein
MKNFEVKYRYTKEMSDKFLSDFNNRVEVLIDLMKDYLGDVIENA